MYMIIDNVIPQKDFDNYNKALDFITNSSRFKELLTYGKYYYYLPEFREKYFDPVRHKLTSAQFFLFNSMVDVDLRKGCEVYNNSPSFYKSLTSDFEQKISFNRVFAADRPFKYDFGEFQSFRHIVDYFQINFEDDVLRHLRNDFRVRKPFFNFDVRLGWEKEYSNIPSYNLTEEENVVVAEREFRGVAWFPFVTMWINVEREPVELLINNKETVTLPSNSYLVSDRIIKLKNPSDDWVKSVKLSYSSGGDNVIDNKFDEYAEFKEKSA
jgi:hypothetical protein